jgi:hypothetical protein
MLEESRSVVVMVNGSEQEMCFFDVDRRLDNPVVTPGTFPDFYWHNPPLEQFPRNMHVIIPASNKLRIQRRQARGVAYCKLHAYRHGL